MTSVEARLSEKVIAYVETKPADMRARIVQSCRKALTDNYNLHAVLARFSREHQQVEEDFALAMRLQQEETDMNP